MIQPEVLSIKLAETTVAALAWGPKDGLPILAMHGWLDNAASFIPLAPYLQDFRIIAIDLPGHGLSDHAPQGAYFHFYDYAPDVIRIMNELGLQQCALLGHSLGAGIASILAAVFPERITAMGLIDGLGPITVSDQQLPELMRKSIEEYQQLPNKKLTVYPNKELAIEARLTASKIKRNAVELLVERGLKQIENGYIWRTDPRLLVKPLIMLDEAQVTVFLKKITAHTCLLRPSPGWPFDEKIFTERVGYLKNIEVHRIDGHHHIHMDHPEVVGPILQEFFKRILK